MTSAFTRKLSRFVDLTNTDLAVLERLSANPEPRQRGTDLVQQGERTGVVNLLLDGWAYRYKVLRDGQRQIVGYLLPGDICDLHVALLTEIEHSVGLLTDAQVVQIPATRFTLSWSRTAGLNGLCGVPRWWMKRFFGSG